ncbi:thioredoxin family protein [Qipengyuania sp. 6B39]|uniref:protein-disulfide reductase DsbD family protein n=1 Tax=Qipengyuania proteolytica TaxID=2867239 RepID=UPI001C89836B|nr:thioredoxin family protein [Qipengyuania proteolytica]MBX7495307.1 thioredoxin family protein [Qipengyuania proteolytica]
MLLLASLLGTVALAQSQPGGPNDIAVEIYADRERVADDGSVEMTVALRFVPRAPEWHGYWSNPGDAGLGMEVDWSWPAEWFGEAAYPLPKRLVIGDLMNHIYEGEYAVLYPVTIPAGTNIEDLGPLRARVRYLACTDTICVPQTGEVRLDPSRVDAPLVDVWRADAVPPLGSEAGFEFTRDRLRIGIPLPAASDLAGEPHVFVATNEIGGGQQLVYTGVQTFIRQGDLLVAEIPLRDINVPADVELAVEPRPEVVEGILDLGNGRGLKFMATPADVPLEGVKPIRGSVTPAVWQLLLAALAGGLLLNIMPCVFPILSLKALSLAKAGGDERTARSDALAYTAGVVLACAALGLVILALRSAGEQVGWAFQLQQPVVVVALFLLALAITANFLGWFEVPGMAISGQGRSRGGSFATGLLAAFVATPCTGPFMALALGAALVIPPLHGLAVFVALGVGLALPFLLVGFVPAIRARLPKPGPWMERFRRWMALPMGLTALALAWLVWRIGGGAFLLVAGAIGAALIAGLYLAGRFQRRGKGGPIFGALAGAIVLAFVFLPTPQSEAAATESLLDPVPFSDTALDEARATGRPVFVWFTADWCVTCKINESVAIEREATRAAFADAGVIAMRADWTRPDEEISRMLTQQGAAGIPLYLWYAPGKDAEQLPQVLTPDLLAEKARASR